MCGSDFEMVVLNLLMLPHRVVPLQRLLPEILLVSSPGYGVIDSGCGRTIIGQNTLDEFKQLWKARGIPNPEPMHEINHFKYGNGERETSECAMKLPVVIAGFSGIIKAAVVKGNAPIAHFSKCVANPSKL